MAVTNAQELTKRIQELKEAQKIFATYTQEQVDEIFRQAALAAIILQLNIYIINIKI